MTINFSCPKCESEIEVERSLAGEKVRCPTCDAKIEIPEVIVHTGQELGGFQIKRLLAFGTAGEVYLATQLSMDRDVALKVFPPSLMTDPDEVEQFFREVRVLGRFNHPNVVTAFEAGESDGIYYMAMSYVDGETLDELLERQGSVPAKEAVQIGLKVAEALDYAWESHQILHRDIKPGNIMIDREGEVQLMDMGISKHHAEESQQSMAGFIVGTPYYMSPEQTRGEDDLDFRSDMYSLGATMFHLVTGAVPYDGAEVLDILAKHNHDPVPSARARGAKVPDKCDKLLQTMMAKSPADRYDSWAELMQAMHRATTGKKRPRRKPRRDAGIPAAAETGGAPRRWPAVLGVILLILLAAGAATGALLYRKHQERQLRQAEEARQQQLTAAQAERGRLERDRAERDRLEREHLEAGEEGQPETTADPQKTTAAEADARKMAELEKLCSAAVRYARENPADPAGSLDRLRAVIAEARGTVFERRAQQAIRQLQPALDQAVERLVEQLVAKAIEHVDKGDLAAARNVLLDYDGPLAVASAQQRAEEIGVIEELQEQKRRDADKAKVQIVALTETLANALLEPDAEVVARIKRELAPFQAANETAAKLIAIASHAMATPARVRESFRQDIGKTIMIYQKGNAKLTIELTGVTDNRIEGSKLVTIGAAKGRIGTTVSFAKMDWREKFKRLGDAKDEEALIARGLQSAWAGKDTFAAKDFDKAGGVLGEPLGFRVANRGAEEMAAAAEEAFQHLAAVAGTPREGGGDADIVDLVWRAEQFPAILMPLRLAYAKFSQRFGDEAAKTHTVALKAFDLALNRPPRSRESLDQKALAAALIGANPLLDADRLKITSSPDGLVVDLSGQPGLGSLEALGMFSIVSLKLAGSRLRDLAPLANLPLVELDLTDCKYVALKPLVGLPIRRLHLANTPIRYLKDVAPFPLVYLDLSGTRVNDLRPLAGKRIRELRLERMTSRLNLEDLTKLPELERLSVTRGIDLTSLKGLKTLRFLGYDFDQLKAVADIWPTEPKTPVEEEKEKAETQQQDDRKLRALVETVVLANFRAQANRSSRSSRRTNFHSDIVDGAVYLAVEGAPTVRDISGLKGLPVKELSLQRTGVADISPLAGMPLTKLNLTDTQVSDLSPLKGIKLEHLGVNPDKIGDLSILRQLPLTSVEFRGATSEHLKALEGLQLESLALNSAQLDDLKPLLKMPLKSLALRSCRVDNLRALRGLNLEHCDLAWTRIDDIGPLREMPLQRLILDQTQVKSFAALKAMPLTAFSAQGTPLKSLQYLAGKQLTFLNVSSTKVKLLSPLQGMPLRELNLSDCPVFDISPLQGLPLEMLELSGTSVRNLAPLKGMPLHRLGLRNTSVMDITPLKDLRAQDVDLSNTKIRSVEALRGLPLRNLRLDGCGPIDVSPLAECGMLGRLTIPERARNVEALRTLRRLRYLDDTVGASIWRIRRASEFWAAYDETHKK